MKEFGWTIQYVMSLTFPIFFDLFSLIRKARYDAAIDEFYTPYAAVKYGGKCSQHLFAGRGSFLLELPNHSKTKDYTPAQLRKANAKLQKLMKLQQKRLEEISAS